MKIMVLMSGGTSPVINATLYGLLEASASISNFPVDFIFPVGGVEGLLKGETYKFSPKYSNLDSRLLHLPGSSELGTSRVGRLSSHEQDKFQSFCAAEGVTAVVNIGGNGTLQQTIEWSQRFSNEISFAFAPKTVDNDLGDSEREDLFFTPGFPTAVSYLSSVLTDLNRENIGARGHEPIHILQVFGRDTGFLAASLRASDPERQLPLSLLLPEDCRPVDQVLEHLAGRVDESGRQLVVVAEGYPWDGLAPPLDPAGQPMYSSSTTTVSQQIAYSLTTSGCTARAVVPGVLQRQTSINISSDRQIARRIGGEILTRLVAGQTDFAVFPGKNPSAPGILLRLKTLSECAGYSRRLLETDFKEGQFDASDEYVAYLRECFSEAEFEHLHRNLRDSNQSLLRGTP